MRKTILGAALLMSVCGSAFGQTTAITDTRIVTNGAEGVIESGTIVIQDGEITALGAGVEIPEGAEIIDGEGKWVTPGVFAPLSGVGMVEVSAAEDSNDQYAGEAEMNVFMKAGDAFNPLSTTIPVARIEGVTHAAIASAPANSLFGSRGAVVNLSGDFDSVIKDDAFVYMELGERASEIAGGSRGAAWAYLRAALEEARRSEGLFNRNDNSEKILTPYDAQALKRVLNGDIPLIIHVERASDIMNALELREEYDGLDIAIYGASEGWIVADELAEADVPVIVNTFRNLPAAFETRGARLDNAAILDEAGVEVIIGIGLGEAHQIRLLPQYAGNAVANGMDWDSAFAAITERPAELFGLEDETGVLATGRDADLVVWNGDPLEVMTSAEAVYINGEAMPMTSRQTELAERYLELEDGELPFAYR